MSGGQPRGPFKVEELVEAGVGPETYVWCKGMSDWRPADEVAEICRFWRLRLAGIPLHEAASLKKEATDSGKESAADMNPHIGRATIIGPENDRMASPSPETLRQQPPGGMIFAIFCTLLCFPPTGFIAIYMFWRSATQWARSQALKGEDAEELRRAAWDYSRRGRMWTGITFFLGLILLAFLFRLSL